ncbi:hypothetical protein [uncultured Mediterranean phage uvMED]|nr:hypothetical protein [uncultured Mediterranean phage uvMED]
MIDDWCEGCKYSTFPYKAKLPLKKNNSVHTFTSMDDVWYVVNLLKEEVEEHNQTSNKKFPLHQTIKSHIPFFTCSNHFLDKKMQKDIQRYTYSKKMNVAPYEGAYGNHPKKWIHKCNVIEKMLNYIESQQYKKIENGKKL